MGLSRRAFAMKGKVAVMLGKYNPIFGKYNVTHAQIFTDRGAES